MYATDQTTQLPPAFAEALAASQGLPLDSRQLADLIGHTANEIMLEPRRYASFLAREVHPDALDELMRPGTPHFDRYSGRVIRMVVLAEASRFINRPYTVSLARHFK